MEEEAAKAINTLTAYDFKEILFHVFVYVIVLFCFLHRKTRREFRKAILGHNDRLDYGELVLIVFLFLVSVGFLKELFLGGGVRTEIFIAMLFACFGTEGLTAWKDVTIFKAKVQAGIAVSGPLATEDNTLNDDDLKE
jgi:hypothetical protein